MPQLVDYICLYLQIELRNIQARPEPCTGVDISDNYNRLLDVTCHGHTTTQGHTLFLMHMMSENKISGNNLRIKVDSCGRKSRETRKPDADANSV